MSAYKIQPLGQPGAHVLPPVMDKENEDDAREDEDDSLYETDDDDDDDDDDGPAMDHGDTTDDPNAQPNLSDSEDSEDDGMMTVRAYNRTTGETMELRAPKGTPMPEIVKLYTKATGLQAKSTTGDEDEDEEDSPTTMSSKEAAWARNRGSPQNPRRRSASRADVKPHFVSAPPAEGLDDDDDDAHESCWDPTCMHPMNFDQEDNDDDEGDDATSEKTDVYFDWASISCF